MRLLDLSGQVFGHLTAKYRGPNDPQGRAQWFARCDLCGGTELYRSYSLTRTDGCATTECGCAYDLTGKVFGHLEVLREGPRKGERIRRAWVCQCDCGSDEVLLSSDVLTRKWRPTRSCGCRQGHGRKIELPIGKIASGTYLRILGPAPSYKNLTCYFVRCERPKPDGSICGAVRPMQARRIGARNGNISCRCQALQNQQSLAIYKHGQSPRDPENPKKHKKTKLYQVWLTMKSNCLNPRNPLYRYYGDRGISIYSPWLEFLNFQADVLESIGEPSPGMFFSRIDKNGDYVPGNISWEKGKKRENVTFELIRDI